MSESIESYGAAMTAKGLQLIAKIIASQADLTLVRVMMGSGAPPEGTYIGDLEDLVEPVAAGTVSVPVYNGPTVEMTVEYRSDMNGGLQEGFIIREFGIFARDPDAENEEVMILYGNLSKYPQYIAPYSNGCLDVRRYPVSITVAEGTAVILDGLPSVFVTYDDLQQLINEGVIGISQQEVTIPTSSWGEGSSTFDGYPYHADVPITGAKSRMTPIVTIYPEFLGSAGGICQTAETIEGAVRLCAKAAPSVEIKASVALIGGSGYISIGTGDGGSSGLSIGEGLTTDFEGRVSIDKEVVMTKEDIADESEVAQSVANILNMEVD